MWINEYAGFNLFFKWPCLSEYGQKRKLSHKNLSFTSFICGKTTSGDSQHLSVTDHLFSGSGFLHGSFDLRYILFFHFAPLTSLRLVSAMSDLLPRASVASSFVRLRHPALPRFPDLCRPQANSCHRPRAPPSATLGALKRRGVKISPKRALANWLHSRQNVQLPEIFSHTFSLKPKWLQCWQ